MSTNRTVPKLKDCCFDKISESILRPGPPSVKPLSLVQAHEKTGLPIDLSQELFDYCMKRTASEDVNRVLDFFNQVPFITPLQELCLENSKRANAHLVVELVNANKLTLTHLDVRGCHGFPKTFWNIVNEAKIESLITTDLDQSVPLLNSNLKALVVDWKPRVSLWTGVWQRVRFVSTYYDSLLENVLPNLKYLDLSWCPWVKKLKCLKYAKNLEILILRNTNVTNLVQDILQLEKLRVLDISVGLDQDHPKYACGIFEKPEMVLEELVTSLPNLEHLNISGTNLFEVCEGNEISALESRRQCPFEFLGVYSFSKDERVLTNLPANKIAGESQDMTIFESIKRNHDMPRTLRDQLQNLRSFSQPHFIETHVDSIASQLITVLLNLRHTEHDYLPLWSLESLQYFLEHIVPRNEKLNENVETQILLMLNRLVGSYSGSRKLSEVVLEFLFQILTRLLTTSEKKKYGKEFLREITRLCDFLLSLNSSTFVYLKTEVIMYRLLYRISFIPDASVHLGKHKIITMFFGFFRTLQIYLGFSLSLQQISKIVVTMWTSILHFLEATSVAVSDLLKHNGLSWMNAHLIWFKGHNETVRELAHIFKSILDILENMHLVRNQCAEKKSTRVPSRAVERMLQLRNLIEAY